MRRLETEHDLDERAARNLLAYLDEEREATGALPTERTIVLERFRDELGDWRICLLTPFGARVHAPWALAIEARLRDRLGLEVQPLWSDDGIVIRLPSTEESGKEPVDDAEAATLVPSDEVEELVVESVGNSALFASRFRENAARALLLPRRRPGLRTPLWQSRQRAGQLLTVASRYGSFPIILETYREVLQDVFDLPALREILAGIERREIRVVSVETRSASPFASSLLFDYIAAYMYEGDAPLADRRAQALALDRDLLRELLGADELRELLDADALAQLELELQALTPERAAGSVDQVHDLLRRLGDLSGAEVAARVRGADERSRARAAGEWLEALAADRRAVRVRIAGQERWIAAEDAGTIPRRCRRRAAARRSRGVPRPGARSPRAGCSRAGHGTTDRSLQGSPRRAGACRSASSRRRWSTLVSSGVLVRGEFRPGGVAREWCDPEVLRSLRRRSLAQLRREVEPVEPRALARFLPAWQGVGSASGGTARLAEVLGQLEGLALPASALERDILPARVRGYVPRLLDELGSAGEIIWVGTGSLGKDDGRVALYRPDRLALLLTAPEPLAAATWLHEGIRTHLASRGASFYREILAAVLRAAVDRGERQPSERQLLDAIWDLVWATELTNDTFAPLRALRWPRNGRDRRAAAPRLGATGRMGPPEAAGRWSLVSEAIATSIALAGGSPPSATERAPRAGRPAAGAPRRRDPRRGRCRGNRGRVFGGLPAAARDGRARSGAPRLLRGGPWRCAVRTAGRGRPAACRTHGPIRRPNRRGRRFAAGGDRSGPAVRRDPAVASLG